MNVKRKKSSSNKNELNQVDRYIRKKRWPMRPPDLISSPDLNFIIDLSNREEFRVRVILKIICVSADSQRETGAVVLQCCHGNHGLFCWFNIWHSSSRFSKILCILKMLFLSQIDALFISKWWEPQVVCYLKGGSYYIRKPGHHSKLLDAVL